MTLTVHFGVWIVKELMKSKGPLQKQGDKCLYSQSGKSLGLSGKLRAEKNGLTFKSWHEMLIERCKTLGAVPEVAQVDKRKMARWPKMLMKMWIEKWKNE